MKQATLVGINQLALSDVPVPDVTGPNDVLVKVQAATICGADVHMLHGHHPPNRGQYPSPIGHEGAGVVEAVGPEVTSITPGDRVATMEQHNGCLAEYVLTTTSEVLPIPTEMSFEEAAILELHQAVYSMAHQCFRLGETAVIIGQGSAGLLFTQLARAAGLGQIIVSEPHAPKRALARRFGAHVAIDPGREDLCSVIREVTGGEGADAVVEASGAQAVYPALCQLVRPFGTIGIFGTVPGIAPFDFFSLHMKMLQVVSTGRGTAGYSYRSYAMGLRLVQRGLLQLAPLVTHRFPLAQLEEAFALASSGRKDVLKVALLPWED